MSDEAFRIAKSVAEKRATRCRHFNGVQHDTCKAGVSYAALEALGILPCLPWQGEHGKPVAPCDKHALFTAEEIEAKQKAIAMSLAGVEVSRAAIVTELKRRALAADPLVYPRRPEDAHRWRNPQDNYWCGAGTMPCPVCKTGMLGYSRAGYNGHIHAACSTETCVRWIE